MPRPKFLKKNEDKHEAKTVVKDPDSEEYGIVTRKLGSGRFMLRLNMSKTEVIGRLCGKMRKGSNKKSNWVDIDSVVLVGMRDFQDNVVDIVHVYEASEARELKKSGVLVDEIREVDTDNLMDIPEDDAFNFEEL